MKMGARRLSWAHAQGLSRAAALLSACSLVLYLLLVHTPHLATPASGAAMDMATHAGAGVDRLVATGGSAVEAAMGVDCRLPSALAPRVEPLPALLPLAIWVLLSVVALAAMLRAVPIATPPPRLPGPTRQALLQRFTL